MGQSIEQEQVSAFWVDEHELKRGRGCSRDERGDDAVDEGRLAAAPRAGDESVGSLSQIEDNPLAAGGHANRNDQPVLGGRMNLSYCFPQRERRGTVDAEVEGDAVVAGNVADDGRRLAGHRTPDALAPPAQVCDPDVVPERQTEPGD